MVVYAELSFKLLFSVSSGKDKAVLATNAILCGYSGTSFQELAGYCIIDLTDDDILLTGANRKEM